MATNCAGCGKKVRYLQTWCDDCRNKQEGSVPRKEEVITGPTGRDCAEKDAARLYKVSDAIYKILIFMNHITGIAGGIAAIIAFIAAANTNGLMFGFIGIVIIVVTIIVCFINYAIAVLVTHFAKVLSNISISLLDK